MNGINRWIERFKAYGQTMAISLCPDYATKCGREFWSRSTQTHTDMSPDSFQRYYDHICALVQPTSDQKILDYACGGGQISHLFRQDGYDIACCDISPPLIEHARREFGLDCRPCDEVLASDWKFDTIFMLNAFFYIHPRRRRAFLRAIRRLLVDGGTFFIIDEPDYTKRHKLRDFGRMSRLLSAVSGVYQVDKVGFFNRPWHTAAIARRAGFSEMEVSDSWTDYRSHFRLGTGRRPSPEVCGNT